MNIVPIIRKARDEARISEEIRIAMRNERYISHVTPPRASWKSIISLLFWGAMMFFMLSVFVHTFGADLMSPRSQGLEDRIAAGIFLFASIVLFVTECCCFGKGHN